MCISIDYIWFRCVYIHAQLCPNNLFVCFSILQVFQGQIYSCSFEWCQSGHDRYLHGQSNQTTHSCPQHPWATNAFLLLSMILPKMMWKKHLFWSVGSVRKLVSFQGAPSTRQAHSQTQWFLVQIPSYHRLNGNLSTIELVVDMTW